MVLYGIISRHALGQKGIKALNLKSGMSHLSKTEIEHIAELARLYLSEEEKEKFGEQLSSILDYVEKLQSIDTSRVATMAHGLDLKNVTRDDEIKNCSKDSRDLLMSNLPDRQDDLVRVPAVFE